MSTILPSDVTDDGGGMTSSALSHRDRLVQFYTEHNPSKIPSIESLLKKYEGDEEALIQKVHLKYDVRDVVSHEAVDDLFENERYSYLTMSFGSTYPAELESAWIYHLHQLSHAQAKIHRVSTARVVRWRLTKAKLRAQLATLPHKTLQSKRDLVQRAIWFPHEKGYIWRASVGGMFVGLKDFWVERLELSFSLTCTTSHVVVIFHGAFCGQFDGVKVKGDKGTRIPNAKWTQVDVDMHFRGHWILNYQQQNHGWTLDRSNSTPVAFTAMAMQYRGHYRR
ncbi:hypothetical protein B5M09_005142 [Aphanomyces astaci]|uniref:Uncharacterized protein n=1 Tax=Aphanomyces astaci TaxID=112090 RepID=A0A3R7Z8I8_APHAT|nr:hypothetical protein B5M09_005142 [Aphanomyces astaci]